MKLLIIGRPEREENLRLVREGQKLNHDIKIAGLNDVVFIMTDKFQALLDGHNICDEFTAVFIRNIFPLISEGLLLAELAHQAGLRVMDRALATSNYVQSKTYQAWKLGRAGLTMPTGFQAINSTDLLARLTTMNYPVVLKGVHGSQGTHVHLCQDESALTTILNQQADGFFIVQEYLKIKNEYRVLLLGGRTLGAIRKIPPVGDFRHNISLGGTAEPAELPTDLLRLCEKAAQTLDYEFAGVDLALTADDRPIILEVNRAPGFIGFETATGINVAEKVISYLTNS